MIGHIVLTYSVRCSLTCSIAKNGICHVAQTTLLDIGVSFFFTAVPRLKAWSERPTHLNWTQLFEVRHSQLSWDEFDALITALYVNVMH